MRGRRQPTRHLLAEPKGKQSSGQHPISLSSCVAGAFLTKGGKTRSSLGTPCPCHGKTRQLCTNECAGFTCHHASFMQMDMQGLHEYQARLVFLNNL